MAFTTWRRMPSARRAVKRFFRRTVAPWAASFTLVASLQSHAQFAAGSGFASWVFEVSPTVGINLPFDLWGVNGQLNNTGIRTAYGFTWGIIEAGFLYQSKGIDRAYTTDVSFRWDIHNDAVNAYFAIGYHLSLFDLTLESHETLNSKGDTIVTTDSGWHSGLAFGGGLLVPLRPSTALKLGMKYYNNPQLWLLLEIGLGLRF